MSTNTFNPITFTISNISFNEAGKKVFNKLPHGWNKINKDNMNRYNHASHKIKCIITGKKSMLTVIDCDTEEAYNEVITKFPILKECKIIKTPRGYHIYTAYQPLVSNSVNDSIKVDIRNDGGFVVAAPSVCNDESVYHVFQEGDTNVKAPCEFWSWLLGDTWDKPPEPECSTQERVINIGRIEDRELQEHLCNISVKDLSNYNTWRDIGWACLDAAEDVESTWEIFDLVSRKCKSKYDEAGVKALRKSWKPAEEMKRRPFTAGTIKYFSKKNNRNKYFKIIQNNKPRIWGNHLDAALDFLELRQGTMFMNKHNIYVYEDEEWEKEEKNNSIVMKTMVRDLLDFYQVSEDLGKLELDKYEEGTREHTEAIDRYKYIKSQRNSIGNYQPSRNIYNRLREIMTNDNDILFDTDPKQFNYIHYKNGKLNLFSKEFSKRDINDLITKRLSYNYHDNIDAKIYYEVESWFKKFETREVEHKFFMEWLFYNLTGHTDSQKFLHMFGSLSSNGKSQVLKIMSEVFKCYVMKVDKRMFEAGSSAAKDKFLEKLDNDCPRMCYIEEVGNTKLDSDMFKDMVDGEKITYKKLYSESQDIDIICKITNLSNQEPNMDVDDAIKRRLMILECKSQFLDINSILAKDLDWDYKDNWDRRLFAIDYEMNKKIREHKYKLAVIKYILKFPARRIKMPDSVVEKTTTAIDEIDNVKSLILENYIITKNKNDRVDKNIIYELLSKINISKIQLNRRLKTYGITLNSNMKTTDGVRGCYVGLHEKTDEEE